MCTGRRSGRAHLGITSTPTAAHPNLSDPHLVMAVNLYGPNAKIRALQLVWADNHGRLPWDPWWSHGRRSQPVFGLRTMLESG